MYVVVLKDVQVMILELRLHTSDPDTLFDPKITMLAVIAFPFVVKVFWFGAASLLTIKLPVLRFNIPVTL